MEPEAKLAVLARAGRALNASRAVWALGASALLYLHGVTEDFHDLDLLIDPDTVGVGAAALLAEGAERRGAPAPSAAFCTERFEPLRLAGVDIDLLCNFTIRRKEALYRYDFHSGRIEGTALVQRVRIPLCPLADWFVLYQLMPARAKNARLIARHLASVPEGDSRLWLTQWLNSRLPGEVRERTLALYQQLPHPER